MRIKNLKNLRNIKKYKIVNIKIKKLIIYKRK